MKVKLLLRLQILKEPLVNESFRNADLVSDKVKFRLNREKKFKEIQSYS